MAENFNAYHKWLGIPLEQQPPNYYQLLGVAVFEDDADVIANAADQRMAHVRTFQSGKNSELSQKVLNQLAQARLCLLKPDKKTAYDTALRQHQAAKKLPAARPAATPPVARRPGATPAPAGSPAHGNGSAIGRASGSTIGQRGTAGHPAANGSGAQPVVHAQAKHVQSAQVQPGPVQAVSAAANDFAFDGTDSTAPTAAAVQPRAGTRAKKQAQPKSNFVMIAGAIALGVCIAGGITAFIIISHQGSLAQNDDNKHSGSPKDSGGDKSSGEKSSGEKSTDVKPADSKPTEVKPADVKPADVKPADTQLPTTSVADNTNHKVDIKPATNPTPAVSTSGNNTPGNNSSGNFSQPNPKYLAAIQSVRDAIARLDHNTASIVLESLKDLATEPAQQQELARLTRLTELEKEALDMLRDRMKKLTPGDEFTLSNQKRQKVRVVEIHGDSVTFDSDGKQFTYTAERLPPIYAEQIVMRDEAYRTPEHLAALAAIMAVHPNGNRNLAKTLADRASGAGFDVSSIRRELPSGFPLSNGPKPPDTVASVNPSTKPNTTPDKSPVKTPVKPPEPEKKIAVPTPDAQEKAKTLVANLYKDDVAKARTPQAKLDLAKTFLTQADQSKDDPAAQYVLLGMCRDLAVEAGEIPAINTYLDRMSTQFEVNIVALKIDAISKASKTIAAGTPASKTAADALLALIGEAIANEDFEAANEAQKAASLAASKSRDAGVMKQATAARKEIVDLQKQFEQVGQARETLKTTPADAAANSVVGRFACFVRHDWEEGLPLLAKGDNDALQAAAKAEIAAPKDGKTQMELADMWWTLADKEPAGTKLIIQKHAGSWYEKSVAQLSGLAEVKVKKRLKDLEEAVAASDHAGDTAVATKAALIKKKKVKDTRVAWKNNDANLVQYTLVAPKIWAYFAYVGAAPRSFTETDRTEDYIEMREDARDYNTVRLYNDHSENRFSDFATARFSKTAVGGWLQ